MEAEITPHRGTRMRGFGGFVGRDSFKGWSSRRFVFEILLQIRLLTFQDSAVSGHRGSRSAQMRDAPLTSLTEMERLLRRDLQIHI